MKKHPLQDGWEVHPDYVAEPIPPLRTVLTEPVVLSIANYLWLAFIDVALRALQPLFLATPIRLGGLGMSPAAIGLCLGVFGLLDGTVQVLFFAKVIRRIGLKKVLLTTLFCFIPLFALFPVINYFAREGGLSPAVWALLVFHIMINCITEMSFGRCSLNASTSFTPLTHLPRLCLPIHDLLRGESTSTRERAWHRANHRLARSGAGSSNGNVPLRIHAAERLARGTRSLHRLRYDIPMRHSPRIQAPGGSMGIQRTKHLTSRISFGVWVR